MRVLIQFTNGSLRYAVPEEFCLRRPSVKIYTPKKSIALFIFNKISVLKRLSSPVLIVIAVATLVAGVNIIKIASEQFEAGGVNPDRGKAGEVTMHAAGRGKPLYNFSDGTRMSVDFRGQDSAVRALSSGVAEPRALSSGDLDGNGTPDVV